MPTGYRGSSSVCGIKKNNNNLFSSSLSLPLFFVSVPSPARYPSCKSQPHVVLLVGISLPPSSAIIFCRWDSQIGTRGSKKGNSTTHKTTSPHSKGAIWDFLSCMHIPPASTCAMQDFLRARIHPSTPPAAQQIPATPRPANITTPVSGPTPTTLFSFWLFLSWAKEVWPYHISSSPFRKCRSSQ